MGQGERNRASVPFDIKELLNIDIGEELVRYRSRTGLSESEVAEKLGLSENYVRLIEWGLTRSVSPAIRQRIVDLARAR